MKLTCTIRHVGNFYTLLVESLCIYVTRNIPRVIDLSDVIACARADMFRNVIFDDNGLYFDGLRICDIDGVYYKTHLFRQRGEIVKTCVLPVNTLPVYRFYDMYIFGDWCLTGRNRWWEGGPHYFDDNSFMSDWFGWSSIPVRSIEMAHELPGFTKDDRYVYSPNNIAMYEIKHSSELKKLKLPLQGYVDFYVRSGGFLTGELRDA